MNFVKKLLLSVTAVLAAALLLLAAAPKALHATVATLVQVVNTAANPVPTSDVSAQSAFTVEGTCTFGENPDNALNYCELLSLYTVPAGKIAVLESFSASCYLNSGTLLAESRYSFTNPTGNPVDLSVPPSPAVAGFADADMSLKAYAEGGSSGAPINFLGVANTREDDTANCNVTVSGYLK